MLNRQKGGESVSRVPRPVFLCFDYTVDLPRASMIRDMVRVTGDYVFFDINWTVLSHLPEETVKAMIDEQLERCDCLLVLITGTTARCPLVNYEIQQAYEMRKGIVGIYAHHLRPDPSLSAEKGANPFFYLYTGTKERLCTYLSCYDPPFTSTRFTYDDIYSRLDILIEEAIRLKSTIP